MFINSNMQELCIHCVSLNVGADGQKINWQCINGIAI